MNWVSFAVKRVLGKYKWSSTVVMMMVRHGGAKSFGRKLEEEEEREGSRL